MRPSHRQVILLIPEFRPYQLGAYGFLPARKWMRIGVPAKPKARRSPFST